MKRQSRHLTFLIGYDYGKGFWIGFDVLFGQYGNYRHQDPKNIVEQYSADPTTT